HAAALAEHFAYSSDPADLGKAVRYSELAAQRARSVYAYGEAVRLLEQAIEEQDVLDPDDRLRRCDLLLALGEALMAAGEAARADAEVAETAYGLAAAFGDQGRAARASRLGLLAMNRYGSATIAGTPRWRTWAERADRSAPEGSLERVWADYAL